MRVPTQAASPRRQRGNDVTAAWKGSEGSEIGGYGRLSRIGTPSLAPTSSRRGDSSIRIDDVLANPKPGQLLNGNLIQLWPNPRRIPRGPPDDRPTR
ncbi:hypothetical protein VTN31DRAFT_7474 [Thermomyces dupontii]|uniref:uncharacterized protein n=1 Tax=Talaromyces thermophilus TaxID=28565 RepID=UPI0037425667